MAFNPLTIMAVSKVGTAVILAGLMVLAQKLPPLGGDKTAGVIAPSRVMGILFAALCAAFVAFFGFVTFSATLGVAFLAGGLALFFLGMLHAILHGMSQRHRVVWDEQGIEGPSNLQAGYLGRARARIAWSDITAIRQTPISKYIAVEAGGASVYWAQFYPGSSVLEAAIRAARPDLGKALNEPGGR